MRVPKAGYYQRPDWVHSPSIVAPVRAASNRIFPLLRTTMKVHQARLPRTFQLD